MFLRTDRVKVRDTKGRGKEEGRIATEQESKGKEGRGKEAGNISEGEGEREREKKLKGRDRNQECERARK